MIEFFKQLGPIYIKLGQTLSTRPDIVGEDFALYLRQLQDRLDPFDFDQVSCILQQQWGVKTDDVCAFIGGSALFKGGGGGGGGSTTGGAGGSSVGGAGGSGIVIVRYIP